MLAAGAQFVVPAAAQCPLGELLQGYGAQSAVEVDPATGRVFTARTHSIRVYEPTGELALEFPHGGYSPRDLCVSRRNGDVYVLFNDRVRVFDRNGASLYEFANGDPVKLWIGRAIDQSERTGRVYVAERLQGLVHVFEADGRHVRTFDGLFVVYDDPLGLAVSPVSDEVFVADPSTALVNVFDSLGTLLRTFGGYGVSPGKLVNPVGLDVAGVTGTVAVAERGLYTVSVFEPDGKFVARFGTSGTGPGKFPYPLGGVAFSDNGVLYVTGGDIEAFAQPPVPHCTAKASANGCIPAIGIDGCMPSATRGGGFAVTATELPNQRRAVLLYGVNGRGALPFQGGVLCVAPPLRRAPEQGTGGHLAQVQDCSGAYRIDMNALAAGNAGAPPVPELARLGAVVECQLWVQEPQGAALSAALEYVVGP